MKAAIVFLMITLALGTPRQKEVPPLRCIPGSSVKVCQLSGDYDRATGRSTLNRTNARFGIVGTDLGSSFEHKGKLYFLFGDTFGRPGDLDAIGWSDSVDPEKLRLEFYSGDDGKWIPPKVPGISQAAFEVPSGGISIGGEMIVAFTETLNGKQMGRSVLARSRDDGRTFEVLRELSRDKFINVSFLKAAGWVYIYGSGKYRQSSVSLARVRPSDFGNRTAWQFFAGRSGGLPAWKSREEDAIPLFRHDVVGEFSVAWLPAVNRYAMLYNSERPRGITLRSAQNPSGPWSYGSVIFDPWRDKGYGHFMHAPARDGRENVKLHDPGREREYGGEYGPYIMGRYTKATAEGCTIFFTLSTWNPYQVVVMRSGLRLK